MAAKVIRKVKTSRGHGELSRTGIWDGCDQQRLRLNSMQDKPIVPTKRHTSLDAIQSYFISSSH